MSGCAGPRVANRVSPPSHRLSGQCRTQTHRMDNQWILTCGYGLWRTGRTGRIDLRIKKGPLSPSFMLPRRFRSSVAAAPCGPGRLAAGLVVMLAVLPAVTRSRPRDRSHKDDREGP